MPIHSFIEILSEATERRFLLEPEVRGSVTVLVPNETSLGDLLEVFLSVPELNGVTLVEGGGRPDRGEAQRARADLGRGCRTQPGHV